jgi:hypothetical protein
MCRHGNTGDAMPPQVRRSLLCEDYEAAGEPITNECFISLHPLLGVRMRLLVGLA